MLTILLKMLTAWLSSWSPGFHQSLESQNAHADQDLLSEFS